MQNPKWDSVYSPPCIHISRVIFGQSSVLWPKMPLGIGGYTESHLGFCRGPFSAQWFGTSYHIFPPNHWWIKRAWFARFKLFHLTKVDLKKKNRNKTKLVYIFSHEKVPENNHLTIEHRLDDQTMIFWRLFPRNTPCIYLTEQFEPMLQIQ